MFLLSCGALSPAAAEEWRSAISAGDYPRARLELENALLVDPDNTTLRYQLARVLGFSGMNGAALAEYDRLLARYPDDADYLLGRAQMLGRLGQTATALAVTERALRLAPDYEDIWQLRLQLAEQADDPALAAALRADIAARYPTESWWQRAPQPIEYTRWLTVGWGAEQLSNGAPDWGRQFVRLDWRQSTAASWFGEIARSARFGRSDLSLNLGGDFQALPAWRIGGAVAGASSADFEPGREFSVNAVHTWRDGWGTAVQWRRRDYSTTAVSSYSATGDKYIADYRFAYTVNYSRLHGAGSSLGHTATLGWYPSEQRGMALAIGTGEEIETIGLNRLLRTDVSTVTFTGRNTVATRFTLNWWLGTHRQGDFYRRRYAGLAVRFGL